MSGEVCHLPCAHVLCFSTQGLDAIYRGGDICTCQRIIATQVFFLINHNYYAYKLYARLSWRTGGHIASQPLKVIGTNLFLLSRERTPNFYKCILYNIILLIISCLFHSMAQRCQVRFVICPVRMFVRQYSGLRCNMQSG